MVIKNGKIITPFQQYIGDILIQKDTIKAVGGEYDDDEIIDAERLYVCPGFVDIHTHGGYGGDFMDATDEAFLSALKFHGESGTTSCLMSTVTAPIDQIENMIEKSREYIGKSNGHARPLGVHLEGPFLSVKNKGAQHEKFLKIPRRDGYDFIIRNKDVVKNVTISPELDGAEEMTRELTKVGIVVSGGHDDGKKENIMPVIDAGMSNCTHLLCAMSIVQMRDGIRSVGLSELGLIDGRLTVELIADNHHMPPELIRLAYICKGAKGACVVSDSLRAGGMAEGETLYTLGTIHDKEAQKFVVWNGVGRLPDKTRYAGSIQPLSQMVKNLVQDCNIPLGDAVCMASYTPAKIVHAEDMVGSIAVGKKADFCLMDKDLNVKMTIIDGKVLKRG